MPQWGEAQTITSASGDACEPVIERRNLGNRHIS
jgi:hypothetical protein